MQRQNRPSEVVPSSLFNLCSKTLCDRKQSGALSSPPHDSLCASEREPMADGHGENLYDILKAVVAPVWLRLNALPPLRKLLPKLMLPRGHIIRVHWGIQTLLIVAWRRLCLSLALRLLPQGASHSEGTAMALKALAKSGQGTVVLTRGKGKNDKLRESLEKRGATCVELPLIEHARGKQWDELPRAIEWARDSWVAITSPEAASFFHEAWELAGRTPLRVAAVGKGTVRELAEGLAPDPFVPSEATGAHLAEELPSPPSRVLYPASERAGTDLQEGLAARGFEVWRVDAYTTRTAANPDPEAVHLARCADVAAIASPSALDAWVEVVGSLPDRAACIGGTSARAARNRGVPSVHAPESPGLDGLVDACVDALAEAEPKS